MVIVVTVGTHEYPFDRLVRGARELVSLGAVFVQRGTSRVAVPGAEVVDLLAPSELQARMAAADRVITHGGPGSIRAALAAGRVPLVVPRRRAFGEHVDDHQVAFTRFLGDRIHRVDDPRSLPDAVRAHERVVRGLQAPAVQAREEDFARRFSALVEDLMRGRPTGSVRPAGRRP